MEREKFFAALRREWNSMKDENAFFS